MCPIVDIRGIPDILNDSDMESLIEAVQQAVVSVPEIEFPADEVEVYLPVDNFQNDLGSSFAVTINGLFSTPERTLAVRDQIARSVGETIRQYMGRCLCRTPETITIKVFINHFDPARGGYYESPGVPS